MRFSQDHDKFMEMKRKLNRLFAQLRREGTTARQSFQCCGSCAVAAMPAGRPFVYYHKQDTDHWLDSEDGSLYLGFGANNAVDEVNERLSKDLAARIVALAKQVGLTAEWNGETTHRVLVKP